VTVVSMTGFARTEGRDDRIAWAWEVKGVNGKSFEPRFRFPPGYDGLEPRLRASLGQRVRRGNVSVSLSVIRLAGGGGVLRVNREALAQVLEAARMLAREFDAAPPRIDGLLALRGVLETGEEDDIAEERERREAAMLNAWDDALAAFVEARAAEGARLWPVLTARLEEIERLTREAEASAAAQPEALKARLRAMVDALLEAMPSLPEERLVQEAALLVARADVREELDRLQAHVAAARSLLADPAAIGRRFDFLCQEFNREANTLCSKSADLDLTRIGLALKAAIEQLREQVQNIE
jgi:uncharacterized protein (TIGR00255 family)